MFVKFKDFKDHCRLLPDWYSQEVHNQILTYLPESKLQAVKFLKDKTKEIDGDNALGLKECKDIVDSMATVLDKLQEIQEAYDSELSTFIDHDLLIKDAYTSLSFITFKRQNKIILPSWYNAAFHARVVNLMLEGMKLNACKLIVDTSKSYGTNHIYDLKWAKLEVCDVLSTMISNLSKDTLTNKTITLIEDGAFRGSILRDVLAFVPKTELLKIVEKYSP